MLCITDGINKVRFLLSNYRHSLCAQKRIQKESSLKFLQDIGRNAILEKSLKLRAFRDLLLKSTVLPLSFALFETNSVFANKCYCYFRKPEYYWGVRLGIIRVFKKFAEEHIAHERMYASCTGKYRSKRDSCAAS